MRLILSILLICTFVSPAFGWELRVRTLRSAGVELSSIKLQRSGVQLSVRIEKLIAKDLDFAQARIEIDCALRQPGAGETECEGDISAHEPHWRGKLLFSTSPSAAQARLRVGKASLQWLLPMTVDAETHLRLKQVPIAWLQSRIADVWPELATISGNADADLLLSNDSSQLYGNVAANDLTFDSRLGDIAGSALNFAGDLSMNFGSKKELNWRVTNPTGQLLFGPVYFELPNTISSLNLSAASDERGNWQLPLLHWQDGEGLMVKAAAQFDESDRLEVRVVDFSAQLAAVSKRYLGTALSTSGFGGLQLQGETHGHGRFFDGAWHSFELELRGVHIDDPAGRIQVAKLDGSLQMDPIAALNTLHWTQARLFQLPLGDGTAHWRWSPDRFALAEPLSLALLGGTLRIPALERTRVDGSADWRGSIELDQLDLLNLTTAMAWPHFTGTLSGRLPGFHFRAGGFSTDGDIQLKLFDGQMRVAKLSGERIFGVAPSLSTDISFDNLNLKQLSSVLDFGEIEGWLDGEVKGLRMLDWAPVAFDARVHTDNSYPGKKRISQRAVQGLSSVGGGGAVGNPMMKLVDSFGYAEIGLNCRLSENVCHMGGLDANGTGYTILRGAGLPRLTVVGHQQRVDWPVLLSRLQAASAGQAPVIE
jgi:hypothetical protein